MIDIPSIIFGSLLSITVIAIALVTIRYEFFDYVEFYRDMKKKYSKINKRTKGVSK